MPDATNPVPDLSRPWLMSLSVLLLVLLAVRMTLLTSVYESHPMNLVAQDSESYDRLARSILHDGRFAKEVSGVERPDVIRTPGYPFYIASAYALFGVDTFWPLAIQVVLSVLTLIPLYWMGAMIWSQETGFTAALLYALDYISLLASQMLLTDSLYVFTLVSALSLGVAALLKDRRIRWLLLCFGTLLAVATLIRPVSYYLIAPVLLGFGFVYLKKSGWKKAAGHTLLIALPWLLIVGGWQARNYAVADTTELSAIKGINLMRYRGAYIIAKRDGISMQEAQEVFRNEIPGLQNMSDSEKSAAYTDKAVDLIKAHPGHAVSAQVQGTVQLLLVPGEGDVLRFLGFESPPSGGVAGSLLRLPGKEFVQKWIIDNPLYLAAFVLAFFYLVVLYAGCGVSLINLAQKKDPHVSAQVFLAGVTLYFIVISGGPEGYPRLRMPITPLVALFAASGWLYLLGRRNTHGRRY